MSCIEFPFTAIVGQDDMKRALLLNVINPAIGGVLIHGERGTGKTTIVRGLAALTGGDTKVVELPVGASEDRVIGTVNLKTMMTEGEKQVELGILAEADGNILYVDEINLLEDHIVDVLLDVAATGRNRIERDGISYHHHSRFALVGTMNPEEGTLRPQLLDRFGCSVTAVSDLSVEQRSEVVRRRLAFERDPAGFRADYAPLEEELHARIIRAKEILADIEPSEEMITLTARLCASLHVDGYRADIVTMKVACTLAAFDGRTEVLESDIIEAARLVLPHRGKRRPFDDGELTQESLEQALQSAHEDYHADQLPDPNQLPDADQLPDANSGTQERATAGDTAKKAPTLHKGVASHR